MALRITRGDETLNPKMERAGILAEIRELMSIKEIQVSLILGKGGMERTEIMGTVNPLGMKKGVILGRIVLKVFK